MSDAEDGDPMQAIYEFLSAEQTADNDDLDDGRLIVASAGYYGVERWREPDATQTALAAVHRALRPLEENGLLGTASDPVLGLVLAVGPREACRSFRNVLAAALEQYRLHGRPPLGLLGARFDGSELESAGAAALLAFDTVMPELSSTERSVLTPAESYYLGWAYLFGLAVLNVAAVHAEARLPEDARDAVTPDDAGDAGDAAAKLRRWTDNVAEEVDDMFFRTVTRLQNGEYRLRIPEAGRTVLAEGIQRLRDELLGAGTPLGTRLRPPAYGTDAERSAAWASLAGDQLLASRLEALDTVETCLSRRILSETEITALIQTINGVRLVMGTQLDSGDGPGVEELEIGDLDGSPLQEIVVDYEYLGYLLGTIVAVLYDELD